MPGLVPTDAGQHIEFHCPRHAPAASPEQLAAEERAYASASARGAMADFLLSAAAFVVLMAAPASRASPPRSAGRSCMMAVQLFGLGAVGAALLLLAARVDGVGVRRQLTLALLSRLRVDRLRQVRQVPARFVSPAADARRMRLER